MENKYIFTVFYQNNKFLSHSNLYGHDICIVCEEEDDRPPYCLFTSPHLSSLNNPEEIWARALTLLSLYNGVANLYCTINNDYDDTSNQKLVNMFIWDKFIDITPQNKFDIAQSYPFDDTLILDTKFLSIKNRFAYLINLSKTENDVLHILLQLGNGLEWINLYSIFDSIRTYSKKVNKNHFKNILTDSGYSETDIHAFTGTVNNYGILGVKARHGELGFGVPQKTLNIKESQILILSICKSYMKLTYSVE